MEKINKIVQKRLNIKTENKVNKKLICICAIALIIILCIIIYFLFKNNNKNLNIGNNLSNKTLEEIEEYILNISSYEAEVEVEVQSNKNKTKYLLNQKYTSPNIEKQTVIEPSNIEGLETIYDGSNLTIHNSKLNLSTIYENYAYLTDNFLWLNSFIEEYKEQKVNSKNTKLYEENNKVVMEVILSNQNPYIWSKKLIIDKDLGSIDKLIVQGKNQKNLAYILYREIKINGLNRDDVLAFKFDYVAAQY